MMNILHTWNVTAGNKMNENTYIKTFINVFSTNKKILAVKYKEILIRMSAVTQRCPGLAG